MVGSVCARMPGGGGWCHTCVGSVVISEQLGGCVGQGELELDVVSRPVFAVPTGQNAKPCVPNPPGPCGSGTKRCGPGTKRCGPGTKPLGPGGPKTPLTASWVGLCFFFSFCFFCLFQICISRPPQFRLPVGPSSLLPASFNPPSTGPKKLPLPSVG